MIVKLARQVDGLRVLADHIALRVGGIPVRLSAVLTAVDAIFRHAVGVLKRIYAVFTGLIVFRRLRGRFRFKALHVGDEIIVGIDGRALRVQKIAVLIGGIPCGGRSVHAAVHAVILRAVALFNGIHAVLARLVIGGNLLRPSRGEAVGEIGIILRGINGLRPLGHSAVLIARIPRGRSGFKIAVIIAVGAVDAVSVAVLHGEHAVAHALIIRGNLLRFSRHELRLGDGRQIGSGLYGQCVRLDVSALVARIPRGFAAVLASVNAVLRFALAVGEHEHAGRFGGGIIARRAVGAGGLEALVVGRKVFLCGHGLRVVGHDAVLIARIPRGGLAVLHAVDAVDLAALAVFNGVYAVFLLFVNIGNLRGLGHVEALHIRLKIRFRADRLRALGDRSVFIGRIERRVRAVQAAVDAILRLPVAPGEGVHAAAVLVKRGFLLRLRRAEALLIGFKIRFRLDRLRVPGDNAVFIGRIERRLAAVHAAIGAIFGCAVAGGEGIDSVFVFRIVRRFGFRRPRHEAGHEAVVILLGRHRRFVHDDIAVFISREEIRAFAGHHAVGAVFVRLGGYAPEAFPALDRLIERGDFRGRFGGYEARHRRGVGAHAFDQLVGVGHAQAEHIVHIAHDEGNDHFFGVQRSEVIDGGSGLAVIAAGADAQHLPALLVDAEEGIELFRVFGGLAGDLNRVMLAGFHVNGHGRPGVALLLGARAVFNRQRNDGVALTGVGDGLGHQRVAEVEGEALRFIFGRKTALCADLRLQIDLRQLPVHGHRGRLGVDGHERVRISAGCEHAQADNKRDKGRQDRFCIRSFGVSHRSPSSDDKKPFLDIAIIYPYNARSKR